MKRSVPILALQASAAVVLAFATRPARAADQEIRQIPDEYESTSGHGVALNNGGYAANDPISAIRANPALIAQQKQYIVAGGYHWPMEGREYYQAAVVDSRTSNVAAGVSYTGFLEDYSYAREDDQASRFDSPIVRRGVLALGQTFGELAMGIGATYVEGHALWSRRWDEGEERVKGVGLNVGGAYAVAPGLTAGASIENASNRKIKDYAPKTVRAGVAYQASPQITGLLDYRQRDRVAEFEGGLVDLDDLDDPEAGEALAPEQLGIGSISAQLQDYLKVMGSYAQGIGNDRRALAGGAALTSRNFSLSYTMARPYMTRSTTHQAVTLSLDVAM